MLRKYLGADKLTLRRGVKKFLDANVAGNGLQKLKKLKELDAQLQIKQFDIGCLCGDIVANDYAVMDEYAENHCTTVVEVHVPMLHSNNRNEAACTEGWHEQSTKNEEQELTAYQVVDAEHHRGAQSNKIYQHAKNRTEDMEAHCYTVECTPLKKQSDVNYLSTTICGVTDADSVHDLQTPTINATTGRNVPMVAYGGAHLIPAELRDVDQYRVVHDTKNVTHKAFGPQHIAYCLPQFAYENTGRHITVSQTSA